MQSASAGPIEGGASAGLASEVKLAVLKACCMYGSHVRRSDGLLRQVVAKGAIDFKFQVHESLAVQPHSRLQRYVARSFAWNVGGVCTCWSGRASLAPIAEGTPAAMLASALSSSSVFC